MWEDIYQLLWRKGQLEQFKGYKRNYLIAVDGTEYFSSEEIHCPNCSTRKARDGKIRYFHSTLAPALVQSGQKKNKVIAMEPEFIVPQDGKEKQDCERSAIKRWLKKFGTRFKGKGTILGDALFANEPVIKAIRNESLNYILTCKVGSNKYLFSLSLELFFHIQNCWIFPAEE